MKIHSKELEELSLRAQNVLKLLGVTNKTEAATCFIFGYLNKKHLKRNYTLTTENEIKRWLAKDLPPFDLGEIIKEVRQIKEAREKTK